VKPRKTMVVGGRHLHMAAILKYTGMKPKWNCQVYRFFVYWGSNQSKSMQLTESFLQLTESVVFR
jgi:hypothetical protein